VHSLPVRGDPVKGKNRAHTICSSIMLLREKVFSLFTEPQDGFQTAQELSLQLVGNFSCIKNEKNMGREKKGTEKERERERERERSMGQAQ
jgi:hypothetical protein